jgi:two-component system, cell cycle response regulator
MSAVPTGDHAPAGSLRLALLGPTPSGRGVVTASLSTPRWVTITALRAVAVLGLAAYAVYSVAFTHSPGLDRVFEDWAFNGLIVAGGLLCALRACWSSMERKAWAVMGVGLGCWAIGEIVFTLDPASVSGAGFPTPSDAFWLVFYPAGFLALGLLVRSRTRQFYPSLWLDGAVGALTVAALAAQFVLPPIVGHTGGSLGTVVADLVYPLGDVLLVAFVVALVALTGWRPGRLVATVSLGFLLGAAADGVSLYLSATGHAGSTVFDALWPASAVVLGWAAWQPTRPTPTLALEGHRLLVMPLSFALAAVGLLSLQAAHPLHLVAYVLAVATVVGVVARMGLTFSENLELVDRSRREALTDALTGLGNRRRLLLDLEDVVRTASVRKPHALLLFDLNGFKRYNDAFGHPAGDALLARLGAKLADAVAPDGSAYRLGGDEFCVLAPLAGTTAEAIAAPAIEALAERGQGFDITTACGSVVLPLDADEPSTALQVADERLYANKGPGRSAERPQHTRDVLLQLLREREPDLHKHLNGVAVLAREVGRRLGMSGDELDTVVRAAELHDVGKVAVPDAILRKPAALDGAERAIVQQHSEVGERILAVATAMRPVARIVRASHERWDGTGYPDRVAGEDIPLGARVVAVCDAFDAMTSDRPYQRGVDIASALDEVRRHAGSQFDPAVVEAFCVAITEREAAPANAARTTA